MENKKKIGIVAHGLSDGGAERVASILANYFSQNGYEVIYIAAYSDKEEYKLDKKIKVFFVRTKFKNKLIKLIDRNIKIYSALKKFGVDIVYSFIINELILTLCKGMQIIYSLRNDPSHVDNGIITSKLREFSYSHAKHVVFQTEGAQAYFKKSIRDNSSIITNPMNVDILPYWNETNNDVFITACRLNEQKNLPMLINAFKQIHEKYPKYKLNIYGEGQLRNQLETQIEFLGANDYIVLKGRTTKIHEIMSESFAFVSSSNFEGLSNSMLEALAIGIPCICTDCPPGGARTFIKNMDNGILTPVGDTESLRNAMEILINNRDLRDKFSMRSRTIRNKLAINNVCKQWEMLIK